MQVRENHQPRSMFPETPLLQVAGAPREWSGILVIGQKPRVLGGGSNSEDVAFLRSAQSMFASALLHLENQCLKWNWDKFSVPSAITFVHWQMIFRSNTRAMLNCLCSTWTNMKNTCLGTQRTLTIVAVVCFYSDTSNILASNCLKWICERQNWVQD